MVFQFVYQSSGRCVRLVEHECRALRHIVLAPEQARYIVVERRVLLSGAGKFEVARTAYNVFVGSKSASADVATARYEEVC